MLLDAWMQESAGVDVAFIAVENATHNGIVFTHAADSFAFLARAAAGEN